MGLPSELNPSVRPNRIQGAAFAGPEPDEADKLLARIRKKREDEREAQNQPPAPAPTYISRSDASKLNQIAKQEEKASIDRSNAQTERTLDTAGVRHRQVAGGGVEPKVTSDNRGMPTLEWGSGETQNELGGTTKYDEFGSPINKPEVPVKITTGNKDYGEDPNSIYRVPMGKPQLEGSTPERDATRKSKRIGNIDELVNSDDEAIRNVAIPARTSRDEKVYSTAFEGLKATEDKLRADIGDLISEVEIAKTTPPPSLLTSESSDVEKVEEAKKVLAEEQDRTRRLNEKKSELANHKMLQAELAKQKTKESTFNALMQRGQDVRKQGIIKSDGSKSNDPKDDKIYAELQKSASALNLGNLDPEAPALPKALEGMIPSVVNGTMIGLPESEEAKGVRQEAEQGKKSIDANLENRKQKLAEFTDEIKKPAVNAKAVWTLLRRKTDLAISQHNALIESGAPQDEIDSSSRAIDVLEADLKGKLPSVIMGNQSLASAQELEKDTIETAQQDAQSRKEKIDYEANKTAGAVNHRKYLSGEAVRPKPADINPEAPTDSLMDMARNKEIPTKVAIEASKEIQKAPKDKRGYVGNVVNQTIKGSIRFNQDQASGFHAMVGRQMGGTGGEFFLNASQAARENRDYFDEMFPTDNDFSSSISGGIIKSLTELPAQMMTYVAASRLGIGAIGVGYLGNVSSLYAEAISDQEEAQKKTGKVLSPSQSHVAALTYAIPAAAIDTISDKLTLGLGKKLSIAKLPMAQARNLLAKYALMASKFLWPSIKGGVVEGVTEGAQQRWLNEIATEISGYDPTRDPDEEVARSIIIAAATGGLAVQVTAGATKAVKFTDEFIAKTGGLSEAQEGASFELQKATADIEPGQWEAWTNNQGFGSPSDVVLNARPLAESEPEPEALKPANRLINAGNKLDSYYTDQVDEMEYFSVRAHIAETISALAKAQNRTRVEINELSDTPASKSELSQREAARAASYIITGGGMTEEMRSYKIKGMPIFQTREDGSTILNSSFAENFFKEVPSIIVYNDIKTMIPALEARVEALGMPQTEGSSDEPEKPEKPLLENSPTKLLQRTGNKLAGTTTVERMRSAKEKTAELSKGLSVDGIKVGYEEGEITGQAASMQVVPNEDGSLTLRVDPNQFAYQDSVDPEINNRVFQEEILHVGDFASSYLDAKALGLKPEEYASHHIKRRSDLFNKILEVGKSDTQVATALVSSISLYNPDMPTSMSMEEISDFLGGSDTKTMVVMSELLRQLGQIESKSGLTESRIDLRTSAQGKDTTTMKKSDSSVRELINSIKKYIMAVYKALSRMRKALSSANPQVGAELDDTLSKIQDVLKGKKVDWSGLGVPPSSVTGERSGGLVQPNLPSTGVTPRTPTASTENAPEDTAPPAPPAPPEPTAPPVPPELTAPLAPPEPTAPPPVPPAPPAQKTEIPRLPRDLSGASPRYAIGANQFALNFHNDVDKALYIVAQSNPSRRDADYMKFVVNATGMNEAQARIAGKDIRASIKEIAKTTDEDTIDVPQSEATKSMTGENKPAPTAKQNTIKAFTQGFTGSTIVGSPKIIEATEAKDMEGTNIQPRNRKDRDAYKAQIEDMARNWDPDKAMPGTSTGDGAPILTDKNEIVSGHGRIKAMMEMFRRYPERANAYRAKLMEKFPEMAEQIRSMKMPIVVTEMDVQASFDESNKTATGLGVNKTPEQFLRRLAVRANTGTLATEELAVSDAREIQDNPSLRDIKQNENGDLSENPENIAIQQKFFEIFGSPQQYRNNDETFTKAFKDRVTSALLADAIASSNNGEISDSEKIIISAITDPENGNSGVKTLAAALTKSVARLVSLRQIATEVLGAEKASQLDPLVPIAKSLQAYLEAKRSGGENTPKDWQSFVENNKSQIPGLAENILDQASADVFQPIYEFRDSSAKLSSYINNLASELEAKIQDLKDMGGTDIFGNPVPLVEDYAGTISSAAQKAVEKTLAKTRPSSSVSSRGLPADPRAEQIDKEQEKSELQESWTPIGEEESKKIEGYYSLGLQAPANLAPEQTSAINELVKEVGPIPQYVASMIGIPVEKIFKKDDGEERLSAEALETIALSINQIEKGKSLTIGHEMGVGKGRIVGSIMAVYALKKGLVPVFVTKSDVLYPAMLDDIEDVGFEGQIKPLITNNNWSSMRSKGRPVTMKNPIQKLRLTSATGKLPNEHNAIFTTYSQISSVAKKDVIPALDAIAGRAIFILDESHNAAGTDSSIGEFFRSVIPKSRGAVFSSATAIKSPANIATYFPKTSIPTAIPTAKEFERLAKRFGNPFMQMTSSMLSRAGQMFRLQSGFTWKGQKIPFITSPIKAKQEVVDAHNAANEILGEMRQIEIGERMKNLTKQLVLDAQEAYDGTKAKALVYPLSGQFHNVAANMVLGAKIKDTADLAEAEIKAGRKVFISMDTTGEAFLRDAKEIMEGGTLRSDYDTASKVTFKDFMERYARKLNTNKVKIEPADKNNEAETPTLEFTIDWNKNKGKSNIPNWVSPKSIELHDALMENGFKDLGIIIKDQQATLEKLPISPFDALRAELQKRQILSAEISGRDIAVTPSGSFAQRSVTDQDKQNSLIAFRNNEQTKVLIVSRSGSTGLSAHDDPRNKSSAPRTHIVMQPAPDIVDTIQVLGRTNRNNQQSAPKLVYIYSEDIPAEVRIMAMTQKKMRRLGASTTGKDATAAGESLGLDMLNTYGDNAVALVLANEPELRSAYNTRAGTNFPEKLEEIKSILTSGEPGDGIRRMIHKALILDIEDQRHFFEEITAEYVAMVDFAKQNGTYELESQEKDYKAEKLSDDKAWDAYGVATGETQLTPPAPTDSRLNGDILADERAVKDRLTLASYIEAFANLGKPRHPLRKWDEMMWDRADITKKGIKGVNDSYQDGYKKTWPKEIIISKHSDGTYSGTINGAKRTDRLDDWNAVINKLKEVALLETWKDTDGRVRMPPTKGSGSFDYGDVVWGDSDNSDNTASTPESKSGDDAFAKPARIAKYRFNNPTPPPTSAEVIPNLEQSKQQAETAVSEFLKASDMILKDKLARISNNPRIEAMAKVRALENTRKKSAEVKANVERGLELVGKGAWFGKDTKQIPAYVVGVELNNRFPHAESRQYLVMQTSGFENKVRIPLTIEELAHVNPFKISIDQSPVSENEAPTRDPSVAISTLPAGIYRNPDGSGLVRTPSGFQDGLPPAQLREINAVAYELAVELHEQGIDESQIENMVFSQALEKVLAKRSEKGIPLANGTDVLSEKEWSKYVEYVMPEERKGDGFGKTYDRSRQNATQRDQFVVEGNLLVGANFVSSLFGPLVPASVTTFSTKDGGKTTGVVLPSGVNSENMVNLKAEVAKGQGSLLGPVGKVMDSIIDEEGRPRSVMFSDGSMISGNNLYTPDKAFLEKKEGYRSDALDNSNAIATMIVAKINQGNDAWMYRGPKNGFSLRSRGLKREAAGRSQEKEVRGFLTEDNAKDFQPDGIIGKNLIYKAMKASDDGFIKAGNLGKDEIHQNLYDYAIALQAQINEQHGQNTKGELIENVPNFILTAVDYRIKQIQEEASGRETISTNAPLSGTFDEEGYVTQEEASVGEFMAQKEAPESDKELYDKLDKVMASLAESDRSMFMMYVGGASYQQISETPEAYKSRNVGNLDGEVAPDKSWTAKHIQSLKAQLSRYANFMGIEAPKAKEEPAETEASPMEGFKAIEETKGQMTLFSRGLIGYLDKNAGSSVLFRDLLTAVANEPDALPSQRALAKLLTTPNTKQSMMTAGLYVPAEINPDPSFVRSYYKPSKEGNGMVVLSLNGIKNSGEPIETTIHEYKHVLTHGLLVKEGIGMATGKKELEKLVEYSNRPDIEMDAEGNPLPLARGSKGGYKPLKALIKAYLAAVNASKDTAGNPVADAVFGTGLASTYDMTLHMAPYEEPIGQDGIHMKAEITSENTFPLLKHLKDQGLEGTRPMGRNSGMSLVASKGSPDFVFLNHTDEETFGGMETSGVQNTTLVITPSGIEKLRQQNSEPLFYASYKVRATTPTFRTKVTDIQTDPQKVRSIYYGLGNIHEFVTEMYSDSAFQNEMASIPGQAGIEINANLKEYMQALAAELPQEARNAMMQNSVIKPTILTQGQSAALELSSQPFDFMKMVENLRQGSIEKKLEQATLFSRGIKIQDKDRNNTDVLKTKLLQLHKKKSGYSLKEDDGYYRPVPPQQLSSQEEALYAMLMNKAREEKWPGIAFQSDLMDVETSTKPEEDLVLEQEPAQVIEAAKMEQLSLFSRGLKGDERQMDRLVKKADKEVARLKRDALIEGNNKPYQYGMTAADIREYTAMKDMGQKAQTLQDENPSLALFSRGLMETVGEALNGEYPASRAMGVMDRRPPNPINEIKAQTLKDFIENAMLPESFEIKYKGKGLNPTQLRIEYLKQNPEALRRMLYKEKGKDSVKKLFSRGLPMPPEEPMNNGAQQAPLNDLLASFLSASGSITDEEIVATYQAASEENAPYEVGAPYVGQNVRSAGPFANDQLREVQRVARELRRPIDTIETDASVLAAARVLVATHKAQLYEDLLEGTLETSATNQAAVYLALADDAKNAKTTEELREIAILTMANDIQRTNLARAFRIGRDSQMTAEERNRSFFNTELYRRSPDSDELYKKAISRTLKRRTIVRHDEQIQILQAELDKARSQAGEAFNTNEQWQKWGAYMEARIKEYQDANQLWADQLDKYQVLEQESAKKIEALQGELAKANTSLEQMDWETAQLKIRESKSAQDVLDTVQMSQKDSEAVRLVMAGMVPMAAAKQAGVKPARVMQLMKSLETNTIERFDQVAGELEKQGVTRSQLKAKLTAFANGASLRSRGIEANQEEAPLTKEEILAEIVSAMGFDYAGQSDTSGKADWHNVDGKSSLFDWRKPSNIGVAMQMVRRSQGRQASIGDAVFEAHVALLVSSTSTQLANISKTPFIVTNPFYRMVEAGMSYLMGKAGLNVRLPDGTIGNPYANVSDLVSGATEEAKEAFMAMLPSVINGMKYARLAFNTEKPFYNIDHTDSTLIDEGDQKFYENDPKIPGPLGKKIRLPLRALLAADEFAKSFTAETLVGSIAFRIAKTKGLKGQEMVDYVRTQVSEFGSDSWKIAVERSSRETLNEDVADNSTPSGKFVGAGTKDEPFTFKRLGKAVPRGLNMVSKGISELSQKIEDWGFDPNNGARGVTAPVAFAGSMGLQILRGLTLFARISYNVLQRGLAFTPIGLADSAIGAMNSIKTNKEGRKFMDLTNYENSVAGLTEGAIGTAILMALFRSMEGDKDDDKKFLLITGPASDADSAQRTTRYGHRSYMVRVGDKEIDISRIEPFASTMGFGVSIATAVKDAVNRGGGVAIATNLYLDFGRILSQKTFGGQLRTGKTLLKGDLADPFIDFASVFTAPPIMRGMTEASKDYVSRTKSEEATIFNKDRMLSKFAPAVGAYPAVTGYRTPYAYDYEGKKVPKPFTEVLPNTFAGKAGKFALRNLSPVAVYKKKPASKLNRLVESYNRQQISTDGKTWILGSPTAEITDPYSKKKVRLTLREQETLNSIVQPQLEAMFESNITEADIANPTDKKKLKVQGLANQLRNKYEEQIIRQRYAMGDAKTTK